MNIRILQLIEGAQAARGLTVVIDVFRAFSVEAYAMAGGAQEIWAVGDIETAYEMKRARPDALLAGERGGRKCEGFDFGNSPTEITQADMNGQVLIHTTSAGTQGIANALHADEIITGSLVNASAIAEYIRRKNPDEVSLVCMGLAGKTETEEDTLCAEYIKALLEGKNPDITQEMKDLANTSGRKFFDPAQQEVFPQSDFELAIQLNRFDFVIRAEAEGSAWRMRRV